MQQRLSIHSAETVDHRRTVCGKRRRTNYDGLGVRGVCPKRMQTPQKKDETMTQLWYMFHVGGISPSL